MEVSYQKEYSFHLSFQLQTKWKMFRVIFNVSSICMSIMPMWPAQLAAWAPHPSVLCIRVARNFTWYIYAVLASGYPPCVTRNSTWYAREHFGSQEDCHPQSHSCSYFQSTHLIEVQGSWRITDRYVYSINLATETNNCNAGVYSLWTVPYLRGARGGLLGSSMYGLCMKDVHPISAFFDPRFPFGL